MGSREIRRGPGVLGLALAALAGASTARAQDLAPYAIPAPPPPTRHDIVVLTDGQRLDGEIVEWDQGRHLIIVVSGHRKWVRWADIDKVTRDPSARRAEPPPAAGPAPNLPPWAPPPPGPWDPWGERGGVRVGFDVRAEIEGLFKIYDLTAIARSGAGNVGADGGGGAGIGASFDVLYVFPPSLAERRATWGALSFGTSVGFHYDYYAVGGIDASVIGGGGVRRGQTGVVEFETALLAGGRLGVGSFGAGGRWSGAVLGAAYAPTFVTFAATGLFPAGSKLHPAGLRLFADIGSMAPDPRGPEAIFRLTISWLPHVNDLPTMVGLGLGAAFY